MKIVKKKDHSFFMIILKDLRMFINFDEII